MSKFEDTHDVIAYKTSYLHHYHVNIIILLSQSHFNIDQIHLYIDTLVYNLCWDFPA